MTAGSLTKAELCAPAAISRAPLPKLACAALQMLWTHARTRLPPIPIPRIAPFTGPPGALPLPFFATRGVTGTQNAMGCEHILYPPSGTCARPMRRGWRVLHSPTLSLHGCRQPLAAATSRRVPFMRWLSVQPDSRGQPPKQSSQKPYPAPILNSFEAYEEKQVPTGLLHILQGNNSLYHLNWVYEALCLAYASARTLGTGELETGQLDLEGRGTHNREFGQIERKVCGSATMTRKVMPKAQLKYGP